MPFQEYLSSKGSRLIRITIIIFGGKKVKGLKGSVPHRFSRSRVREAAELQKKPRFYRRDDSEMAHNKMPGCESH